jgi:nitronate monooxygenase
VKDAGLRLICQAQTFADAEAAVAAGADVIVSQGTEAGGHTGTMTLLPLLAGVAEAFPDVALLAAGGVGDGRTLAAALMAGADGAWLGTAFLATSESIDIGQEHKDAIVSSDGADTVFTRAYDIHSGLPWPAGIGERVRRDAFTDEWAGREDDLRATREQVAVSSAPLLYGQSARFVREVRSAEDVVRTISADAEALLRTRPQSLVDRG